MFTHFINSIRNESRSVSHHAGRAILCGTILLSAALILIYAGSAPLWLGRFGILNGGAFAVFASYLSSVVFFFMCGVIESVVFVCRRAYAERAGKIMLDIACAYLFRILWVILFFGGFSALFALICLTASFIFLSFALINTKDISAVLSVIIAFMLVFCIIFIIFTVKFIAIN